VVQDLTFADGNPTGATYDGSGGAAIVARGGRLKIVRSRFVGYRCDATGADLGGGAVRALSQYDGRPVTVVRSTVRRGVCSNGAALSSIGSRGRSTTASSPATAPSAAAPTATTSAF
jgi:hypothetical protein